VLDYSDCIRDAKEAYTKMPDDRVTMSIKRSNNSVPQAAQWKKSKTVVTYAPDVEVETDICTLNFQIPSDLAPSVLLYYRLTNFFQNHRRYVKSLDSEQLKGKALDNSTINNGLCDPLRLNATVKDGGFAYYPCGLIANSQFNDSFSSPVLLNVPRNAERSLRRRADNETYPMTERNIAWESDKSLYGKTQYTWDQVAPPPNWMKRYPNGYTKDHPPPNLHEDEAFQVWMRTAGLPTFSKLALRNDQDVMREGIYELRIEDSEPSSRLLSACKRPTDVLDRLPCDCVRRIQVHRHLNGDGHRGQKSFPGYRLRRRQWYLRDTWSPVHGHSPDQAKVCIVRTLIDARSKLTDGTVS
jgi:hypothetical protein